MSSQATKVILVTEKQNLSQIDIKPFSNNKNTILSDPNIFASSIKPEDKLILDYNEHPVLMGFVDAYRNHRPVTISPDIIWLLILQAFSNYVGACPEKLRTKFVNFQGQKEIKLEFNNKNITELTYDDWCSDFPKFTEQIQNFVGSDVIEALTPDFSTTTPLSLSVGQISIMSAFKNYFKYIRFAGICDFPFINIEGTVEDWEKIQQKLNFLTKYEFNFWTDKIKPIISKIIETKKGNVDKEFWLNMIQIIKVPGPCGGDMSIYDGWFFNFFPFNEDGLYLSEGISQYAKMASELLAVKVKIILTNENKEVGELMAEYVGGFIGLSQNSNDSSLKPEIGWFIRKDIPRIIPQYEKDEKALKQMEEIRARYMKKK